LDEFILTLFQANGHVVNIGDKMSKDLGLTSTRWQVLGAIKDAPRTVAQIARRFESTRQGILFVVNSMVNEGLVEFIDNPDHKRAKLVRFTAHGASAYTEIMRRQEKWINTMSERFDLGKVRAATTFLKKVLQDITES
jgi:DNA-binding MarR family transcriptional regulator